MLLSKGEYFSYPYRSFKKSDDPSNNFLLWEIVGYDDSRDLYKLEALFSVHNWRQEFEKGRKTSILKRDAEKMTYVNERSRKMYNKITGREIDPTNEKDKIFQKWSQLIVTALTEGWFSKRCDEFNDAEINFNDEDSTISVNFKCTPSEVDYDPEDMTAIISSDNWEEALYSKVKSFAENMVTYVKETFRDKFEQMCETFMYGFDSKEERYFFKEYLNEFFNSDVLQFSVEKDLEAWKNAEFNWFATPENPGTVGYPASGSDKNVGLKEGDMLYPIISLLPSINKYQFDMAMRDKKRRSTKGFDDIYDCLKHMRSDKKYYLGINFQCDIETAWKIFHGIDTVAHPYLQTWVTDEDGGFVSNNNIFYSVTDSYKVLPYYAGRVQFA